MWDKIKTAFSIIGAVLSIVLFTVILFLLRRGKTDGRRNGDDSERNQRIEEGIGRCEERPESVSEGIGRCEERTESVSEGLGRTKDGIGRCEEHLQRAEDILRNAIKRSRETEQDT